MKHEAVKFDDSGVVRLTAEMQEALGVAPGSKLLVSYETGKITLEPLLADTLEDLRGVFASTPGLVEELLRERRAQDQR